MVISKLSIHSFACGPNIPLVLSGQSHSVISASVRASFVSSSKLHDTSQVKYCRFPSIICKSETPCPSDQTEIPASMLYISDTSTCSYSISELFQRLASLEIIPGIDISSSVFVTSCFSSGITFSFNISQIPLFTTNKITRKLTSHALKIL
jgi:hypothetical protein